MNQEIISYIQAARKEGLPDAEIKKNLLDAEWEAAMVEDNFTHLKALEHRPQANKDEDFKAAPPIQASALSSKPLGLSQIMPSYNAPTLPQAGVNPANNNAGQSAPFYKKKKFWASLIIFILLAGGAAAAYVFVYASPERVWKKFTELTQDKVLSSDFNFAYKDNSQATQDDLLGLPISNIRLEIGGKAYADTSDKQNPQSSSEVSYSFASGNTSFSTGFEYKLIGKKLYLNVGNNPFLEGIVSSLGKGKKIQWVVLDIGEIEKKAGEESSEDLAKFKQIFNAQYTEELKKIWEDAIFVKMEKYLGRESVNNKRTLHFSNSLDKEAIKNTFTAILDKIINSFRDAGEEIKDEDVNSVKMVINALVDKLEVKQFETWIGAGDFKIYKVKIVTSAPSVMSALQSTMGSAQEKSKDAKRLADIRQMASALELYYNDKGRYPESKDGKPVGLDPMYIGIIPTAPIPPDGNCTDYYNQYWYEMKPYANQPGSPAMPNGSLY